MLTNLEAVNIMLSAIGESPVSTSDSLHPDVLSSTLLLKLARLEVLAPGKWFNTEKGITLNRNTSDEIILPSNCLSLDPVDTRLDYVVRGTSLYNNSLHSFKFPENVVVDMVIDLGFELLPFVAQNLIVCNAAVALQANFIGDERKLQNLALRHSKAIQAFAIAELQAQDYNARNTPAARKLLSGVSRYFGGGL